MCDAGRVEVKARRRREDPPRILCVAVLTAALLAGCHAGSWPAASGERATLNRPSPRLGWPATPGEAERWGQSIGADGAGLPEGRGTAAEGESIYINNCLRCHGLEGQGNPADRLVGGVGSLAGPKPEKTVGSYWPLATTLFDYVRRAMPYDRPGSLSDDEVYAICAYLLSLNGVIPPDLAMDRETLPAVRMPNRFGFVDMTGAAGPLPELR